MQCIYYIQVFNGNFDRDGVATRILSNGVVLQHIRFEIVQCSDQGCALRLELYGCEGKIAKPSLNKSRLLNYKTQVSIHR